VPKAGEVACRVTRRGARPSWGESCIPSCSVSSPMRVPAATSLSSRYSNWPREAVAAQLDLASSVATRASGLERPSSSNSPRGTDTEATLTSRAPRPRGEHETRPRGQLVVEQLVQQPALGSQGRSQQGTAVRAQHAVLEPRGQEHVGALAGEADVHGSCVQGSPCLDGEIQRRAEQLLKLRALTAEGTRDAHRQARGAGLHVEARRASSARRPRSTRPRSRPVRSVPRKLWRTARAPEGRPASRARARAWRPGNPGRTSRLPGPRAPPPFDVPRSLSSQVAWTRRASSRQRVPIVAHWRSELSAASRGSLPRQGTVHPIAQGARHVPLPLGQGIDERRWPLIDAQRPAHGLQCARGSEARHRRTAAPAQPEGRARKLPPGPPGVLTPPPHAQAGLQVHGRQGRRRS
jgi:hypothetical protein